MQAVRPSQVKPRGGDITCKSKGTLAEQKPEKKVEMAHDRKWLSNIDTFRSSHAWKANEASHREYMKSKHKKMLSDASHPRCSGRVDVHLSGHM